MILTIEKALLNERSRVILTVVIIMSVAFVHLVFKPFQMALYPMNDYVFVNSWYLILSSITVSAHLILFPKLFFDQFQKLIRSRSGVYLLLTSILISTGMLFFIMKVVFGFYAFTIERIITGIAALMALGLFPFAMIIYERKVNNIGVRNTNKYDTLSISDSHPSIQMKELLYIYSDKNYVVWVCNKAGEIEKIRVRGTLKTVECRLETSEVVRTHRAYLVNKSKIEKISKYHSSYSIKLGECEELIPLSRSFRNKFKA